MTIKTLHSTLIAFITLTLFNNAFALETTQHLKFNTSAISYSDPAQSDDISDTLNAFNYRLNLSERFDNIKIESHYQLSSIYSNNQNITYTDPDKNRLFNLSSLIAENNNQITYHRLDRLFISYNTDNTRTKFGRQSITWGNGLVYNVMDIFNPFSPTAIDKEYKTGDDMLYTQLLTDNGNDWQIIYLPRRDDNSDIQQSESSLAVKYHATLSNTDFDLLFAKHYDSEILGIGFSRPIGETMWRFDITHTVTNDHQVFTSLVTNLDYSWQGFNKNIYGFIELYHNGFGNEDSININNTHLIDRLSRGEVFTPFTNYLAAGISIELHPLVRLTPSLIHEIDNSNSSLITSLEYNWKQNLSLISSLIYNQPQDLTPSSNSFSILLSYYF
jgi:hypothetical protein